MTQSPNSDYKSKPLIERAVRLYKRLLGGLDYKDRPILVWVARLYKLLLGRSPDPDGLKAYADSLLAGTPRAKLVEVFLGSEEFALKHSDGLPLDAYAVCRLHEQEYGFCPSIPEEWLKPAVSIEVFISNLIDAAEDALPELLTPILYPEGISVDDARGYGWWLRDKRSVSEADETAMVQAAAMMNIRPMFSFVMWLDRPNADLWSATMQSLLEQVYSNIELFISMSPSMSGTTLARVKETASRDSRIKLIPGKTRHLAAAFNAAIDICTGDFIGVLGEHDILERSATLELALHLNKFPDTKILFSDEDKIDAGGMHHSPVLKSAWDPEAIMARDTIGRLSMLSTTEIKHIQGMSSEVGRFSEYDLFMRLVWNINAGSIQHLPLILYHRYSETTVRKEKLRFIERIKDPRLRILSQNLKTRNIRDFIISFPKNSTSARIKFGLSQYIPLVSIVIPTRDKVDILRKCLDGLISKTSYPAIEIIIVDNNSREAETAAYLRSISAHEHIRVLRFDGDFNWSAINNAAARNASGDVLLFLNNDTEVIAGDWLREIVSHVVRPEIGVVGAKLLYPDMRIQHAGIIFSPQGGVHTMRYAKYDDPGYLDELSFVRSVSAVTGACLAIRKSIFEEIDGFEEKLQVTWSDVDLCLRASTKGYRTVCTPWAVLIHHEVATRGADETPEKIARAEREHTYMKETWGDVISSDHFQNPNLAPSEKNQKLAIPSRRLQKERGCRYFNTDGFN